MHAIFSDNLAQIHVTSLCENLKFVSQPRLVRDRIT